MILLLEIGEERLHQIRTDPDIPAHFPDGEGVPEVGMLEEQLQQQVLGESGLLQGLGNRGIGINKVVQDLRLHQLQIQEMFGQKTPVFLLTIQGRGQLFNGKDPGLEEALRQVHGISISNDRRRGTGDRKSLSSGPLVPGSASSS